MFCHAKVLSRHKASGIGLRFWATDSDHAIARVYTLHMYHLPAVLTNSLRAAAARFGLSVLLKIAKEWRGGAGEIFSPDLFGSMERLWDLLKLTSVVFRVRVLRVGAIGYGEHFKTLRRLNCEVSMKGAL